MSIHYFAAAWRTKTDTHTMKLVLLKIADNANDDGVACPSIRRIANDCELSQQAVVDQIRMLEQQNYLTVRRQDGGRSFYTLTAEKLGIDRATLGGLNRSTPLSTSRPANRSTPLSTQKADRSTPLSGPLNAVEQNPHLPTDLYVSKTEQHDGLPKGPPSDSSASSDGKSPASTQHSPKPVKTVLSDFDAPGAATAAPADKNAPKARAAAAVPLEDIPPNLRNEAFVTVWRLWERHRAQLRRPLTTVSAGMQLKKLAQMGMQRAIAAIELSLQNGWRGIFEPREQQAAATHGIGDGEQAKWK